MGNRRETRVEKNVPVRIFGTGADGRIFSEKVSTVNVSQNGIEVSGVKASLGLNEVIGVSYNQSKGHFRIVWIGQTGTSKAGHLGLLNVNPDKPFWDFALPAKASDEFKPNFKERRRHTRIRCTTSVELHPDGAAMIWGKASDVSLGGCYIEMGIPLLPGTKLKVGIWMGDKKCWATGKVTNSTPGFGFGIQFDKIEEADAKLLADFLQSRQK